jgi:translation initiation factor 1
MSKKRTNLGGIVFSTDPDYLPPNHAEEEVITLTPAKQPLKLKLETKHRAGKAVTLILGYVGQEEDAETLVKKLKNHCGSGGSAKDGELLIQGDHREKIKQWLHKNGYGLTKII